MRKLLMLGCMSMLGAVPAAGVDVHQTFAKIAPGLKSRVKIAVLLPTRLPSSFQGEKIFPIVDRAAATSYTVDIALSPDCQGERACSEGFVYGSKSSFKTEDVPSGGTPVRLTSEIVALYHRSLVGAHASDGYLTWKTNGANYAIALNTGSLADILLAARSMR
jgi:hypothetical protein